MLGPFKSKAGNFLEATKFDAAANVGHPLVVIVHDFKEDFKTEAYPNPRPVAFVMIADLSPLLKGGEAILYGNAILGGDAVADRLRDYTGAVNEDGSLVKLQVKLGNAVSNSTKRSYRTIEPLEGAELALAVKWDEKNPTALQDERARLEAEAAARGEEEGSGNADNKASSAPVMDDDELAKAIAALG